MCTVSTLGTLVTMWTLCTKEGTRLSEHVRVSEKDKERLDQIGREAAVIKKKKGLTYPEIVSFLIDKYEENKK